MKKLILLFALIAYSIAAKAQVYDGITQPTLLRVWSPVTVKTDGTNQVIFAPFAGVKLQPVKWLSFTPVIQYHSASKAIIPQVWVNINHEQKYYLLMRTGYDLSRKEFYETISGTVKIKQRYMADFTWDNVLKGNSLFYNDRLQFVGGISSKYFVLNAGYSVLYKPGLISNLRIKLTQMSWVQIKYDHGIKAATFSTAIHI